ncbi:MAG: polysaccharide deacetylase family protein [Methylophilus sp.]
MNKKLVVLGSTIAVLAAAGGYFFSQFQSNYNNTPVAKQADSTRVSNLPKNNPPLNIVIVKQQMTDLLASYRKIIVLLSDDDKFTEAERMQVNQVGQALFHQRLSDIAAHEDSLVQLTAIDSVANLNAVSELLDEVENGQGLFDADRLAYRETLVALQTNIAKLSSLSAIKLHKRISEDLDALDEIEHLYDKEIQQVFGRFGERGITLKREKWSSYIKHLNTIYNREKILKEQGVILPYALPPETELGPEKAERAETETTIRQSNSQKEMFGYDFPPKTIALTFDDGPHRQYTAEIAAILKQYNVPAVFFNVGRNLGEIKADGTAKLSKNANISRELETEGFVLGNHSYSHAQLSKTTGDKLKAEIFDTDKLLKAVDTNRPPLFRFPYGAKNAEAKALLSEANLRSIMWNIDSLDWADPVPSSIAERVLKSVEKEKRGIILFHDIHARAVKALPTILDKLTAEGYRFAGWDGAGFSVAKSANEVAAPTPITTGYADSWAILIGIDDYAKWPKLQYATRDAESVRDTLISKFGFKSENVILLKNADATRNGILAAFHDTLAHGSVKKNDRIFVFYAGHGATKHLSSGRDLGYIIPVDSNPNDFATDAIAMTEIQNIAESMTAKHLLFVMDACYSGLGLTRGGGNGNFLRDNARRIGRQMLTAGGADQLVADGGPNGHSVFTWALLQGLEGKGDLNGDGFMTATELAAYVAPSVANASKQTPAFGSLPGSEGGEFVFELPAETEFLNADSSQLSNDAIALNNKLDEAVPQNTSPTHMQPVVAPVVVKDLQGGETTLKPVNVAPSSAKQLAQRANDKGMQHYKEKDYAAAEADFTEALKFKPDFALAANNLGFIFYKQEKYKEAVLWFENTIKIDPSRAIAYVNLGDAYQHLGNKGKTKDAWNKYLALSPNGSSASYVKQQLTTLE